MKILKSEKKGYSVSLEIEISAEEVEAKVQKAFLKLNQSAKVPGFRPGKAPRSIFEKYYGVQPLLEEGLDQALSHAYQDAIQDLNLYPIDLPKVTHVDSYQKDIPLKFSCDVFVKPEFKLPVYKGIPLKNTASQVDDQQLETYLNYFREDRAIFESVDRPAQRQDFLRCHVSAKIGDLVVEAWSRENAGFVLDEHLGYGEAFLTHILGSVVLQPLSFEVSDPQEFSVAEVAGHTVSFSVTVQEIKEKKLPELTDDFVKSMGEPFQTVEELKSLFRQEIQKNLDNAAKQSLRNSAIDYLLKESQLEVPDFLIERELEKRIQQLKSQVASKGQEFDAYLASTNQTQEGLKEQYLADITDSIKLEFILDSIAKEENLSLDSEVIQQELDRVTPAHFSGKKRSDFQGRIRNNVVFSLFKYKVIDFILEHAKIEETEVLQHQGG